MKLLVTQSYQCET